MDLHDEIYGRVGPHNSAGGTAAGRWFEVTVPSDGIGVPPFVIDGRPTNTVTIQGEQRLAQFLEQAGGMGIRAEWREVPR